MIETLIIVAGVFFCLAAFVMVINFVTIACIFVIQGTTQISDLIMRKLEK